MQRLFFLGLLLLLFASKLTGQNSEDANYTIYTEFDHFFDNEIKRQGVKGNWIFRLHEITSLHKFDFDNDGINDVLIEFNTVPVEGGGVTKYYAVLFKNVDTHFFEYVNYIETNGFYFEKYSAPNFIFKRTEKGMLPIFYKLVDGVFKITKD